MQDYWVGTNVSFSAPGLMLKDGEEIAFGFAWACDFSMTMQVYETGSGLAGALEYEGVRLSTSGFVGQPLSNIGLQESSQLRQLSHDVELWIP